MYFFTADIHFGDKDTLLHDNRPFKSINEYDKYIIKDWNKTAKRDDTIFVIGDMLSCLDKDSALWEKGLNYIKKVRANVVLIMGNNEERIVRFHFNNSFEAFSAYCKEKGIKSVHRSLVIEMGGKKYNLVHQIIDGDKRMTNLFGHTHLCSGLYHPYGLCVSTDLNHFRLFTEQIITKYLKRKTLYWEFDDNINYPNPFIKKIDGKWVNTNAKTSKFWQEYKSTY